ncbi:MAG TPA: acyclic terpene utilization AtuA family protein, partial [Myxococcota bacterium]|nr:acyclic terpene utilization AtuA family protein [Myxococcota bacterium]
GPDVTTRFDTVQLEQIAPDRVRMFGIRGEPPPATLKVCINRPGGFRNDMSVCLTGLDVEAKAKLIEEAFWLACPYRREDFAHVSTRLIRTDQPDPASNEQAVAILKLSVKDPDPEKVGRAFSNAVTELGLATIPGFFGVGGGPGDGRPFGVYEPACVPAAVVPQQVVILGGDAREVSSVIPRPVVSVKPSPGPTASAPGGAGARAPLGRVVGTRSGDKGGNANLGVFARSDAAWAWLDSFLTTERLRALLPEVAPLAIDRHRLPALRALNFVIHGLLEEGVAASTRQDPQAKSLGEWLRARVVDVPEVLLA